MSKKPLKRELKKIPLHEHLTELRSRLLWYLASLLSGTALGLLIYPRLLEILVKPINQTLYYSSPAGGLNIILQTGFFFGFLVSLPILVYHILRFVEPAFPGKPKIFLKFILFAGLFMIIGTLFAYFVSLPASLYFLNKFGSDEIKPLISTDQYISFVVRYILGFGLFFQMPVIAIFINKIVKLNVKALLKYQKWVILGSFIIAAVLTPTPDFFNQTIMALPIIALFYLSLLFVYISNHKRLPKIYLNFKYISHRMRIWKRFFKRKWTERNS